MAPAAASPATAAAFVKLAVVVALLLQYCTFCAAAADPRKLSLVAEPTTELVDHKGELLGGNLTVRILWYGDVAAARRSAIVAFLASLSDDSVPSPSVATWWSTTGDYRGVGGRPPTILLGHQVHDANYSLGKSLTVADIATLASRGPHRSSISAVFTDEDVTVGDFCVSLCGLHSSATVRRRGGARYPYLWVGDCSKQCPGFCAWPFHAPAYGPKGATALVPPNRDIGCDGMVINLATLLAGAVTNPYGDGYFQGPADAPLEAATACTGSFGPGSYPGYPGVLLVEKDTGASYNVFGSGGRKFLLPALWDPKTSKCSTL